jgi:hypothetical protein
LQPEQHARKTTLVVIQHICAPDVDPRSGLSAQNSGIMAPGVDLQRIVFIHLLHIAVAVLVVTAEDRFARRRGKIHRLWTRINKCSLSPRFPKAW